MNIKLRKTFLRPKSSYSLHACYILSRIFCIALFLYISVSQSPVKPLSFYSLSLVAIRSFPHLLFLPISCSHCLHYVYILPLLLSFELFYSSHFLRLCITFLSGVSLISRASLCLVSFLPCLSFLPLLPHMSLPFLSNSLSCPL